MSRFRKESVGDIYHVMSRGNGRQLIFEDDNDRQFFLYKLQGCLVDAHLDLYAWCLMGNHFHLLVRGDKESLSRCMHRVCSVYARRFNAKTGHVGHLFQDRFKSEPINDESYLLTVVRYIHKNPEKGGLAPMETYKWSSYHEYVGLPSLCEVDFVLDIFGGRENFRLFHEAKQESGCSLTNSEEKPYVSDDDVRKLAQTLLGPVSLGAIIRLPQSERDASLRTLKAAGLSVRKIELLTGIGRNTICRA